MYPGLRWDSIAALFYSANWRFIVSDQNYFVPDRPGEPSAAHVVARHRGAVLHRVAARRPRRHAPRAPGPEPAPSRRCWRCRCSGRLASALEMALLFNAGGQTPPGCTSAPTPMPSACSWGRRWRVGLALWRRRGRTEASSARARRLLTRSAGSLGVGVCAWTWSQWQYGQSIVFQGGFLSSRSAVAAVILSTVLPPDGDGGPASCRGRRCASSVASPTGCTCGTSPSTSPSPRPAPGSQGTPLFLVRTAVTVAVATVSFYGLERPIRNGACSRCCDPSWSHPCRRARHRGGGRARHRHPAGAASEPPSRPVPHGPPGGSVPASLANAPVRVMLVGDSVALTLGWGSQAAGRWHIDQSNLAILGLRRSTRAPEFGTTARGSSRTSPSPTRAGSCRRRGYVPWPTAWSEWVRSVHPNVVVLLAGRWEVDDRSYHGSPHQHPATGLCQLHQASARRSRPHRHFDRRTHGAHDGPVFRRGRAAQRFAVAPGRHPPGPEVQQPGPGRRGRVPVTGDRPGPLRHDVPGRKVHGDARRRASARRRRSPLLARPRGRRHCSPPRILPLWETLGHEQEAAGGTMQKGPPPQYFRIARRLGADGAPRRQGRRGDEREGGRLRAGSAGRVGADQARFGLRHAGVGVHGGRRPVSTRRRIVEPGAGLVLASARLRARGWVGNT